MSFYIINFLINSFHLSFRFPETMKFFSFRPKSRNECDWPKEFFANWIPFCSDFKDIFKKEINRKIKEK